MKQRLGTVLLLGIYLLVSLQVIFHVHVCEKAGISVQLYTAVEMACCADPSATEATCCATAQRCARPAEQSACCASEQIELGFDQPQQLTEAFELVLFPAEAGLAFAITLTDEADPVAPATWPIDPPPPKVARWRWHCASLTYG
jgi:hypothetical protein